MANVKKRGKTYLITVTHGKDGSGKRKNYYETYKPDPDMTEKQAEKEAHRQAVLFEEKCLKGQVLNDKIRFADFSETWVNDYAEKQCKAKTVKRYKEIIARLNAAFGNIKIGEIQPHHLLAFYDNLAETGVRADIKYTPIFDFKEHLKSVNLTQTALADKAGISVTVVNGGRMANIVLKSMLANKAAELLQALEDEPLKYSTMIQLLLYTGLRRGEMCGLEWRDIDFDKKLLHVQRSSLYVAEKGIFEDVPKNKSSERVIKISDNVVELLSDFKDWQDDERLSLGTAWVNSGRLFTTHIGKPIHPDTVSSWFREFVKRKGLPEVSIHSLRHTNATLMIASGVNIKTVSARLGHSSTEITGRIYSHAIKSADEAAAETLQNILTPMKNAANAKIKLLKNTAKNSKAAGLK